MSKAVLELRTWQSGAFVYVDCGARGEVAKGLVDLFPDARYVGFEPDMDECARLSEKGRDRYSYFPVAAGARSETKTFYLTQNLGCSSLLVPNQGFLDGFMGCGPFFNVVETRPVQVVALDSYLPDKGVHDVDFLELDTQGTELDILQGAESFLSSGVLGLRVEVEFSEMYLNQPLFADVDAYLRPFDFMLFDLKRYHLRRKACPRDVDTEGQLLWGQALYLKDYHALRRQNNQEKMVKLAIVAAFHGFHDYALEIVDFLVDGGTGDLPATETSELRRARARYVSALTDSRRVKTLLWLDRSLLQKPFRYFVSLSARLGSVYYRAAKSHNYFWTD